MGVAAVIWSPARTLRRVADGRSALPGHLVVATYAALSLIVGMISLPSGAPRRAIAQQPSQPSLPPGLRDTFARVMGIGAPISALISPFAIWMLVSLFVRLVARLSGSAGPFSAMPGVVGAAQARNIGYGESAGSCVIPCVGLAILIILVPVVVGLGVAAATSAAQ